MATWHLGNSWNKTAALTKVIGAASNYQEFSLELSKDLTGWSAWNQRADFWIPGDFQLSLAGSWSPAGRWRGRVWGIMRHLFLPFRILRNIQMALFPNLSSIEMDSVQAWMLDCVEWFFLCHFIWWSTSHWLFPFWKLQTWLTNRSSHWKQMISGQRSDRIPWCHRYLQPCGRGLWMVW